HFNPLDALPDPNASLNWGISGTPSCTNGPAPSCSVNGAVGSQTLSCSFGDLTQGTSCRVTVATAMQATDLKDCGNPLNLNNSATVVADNAGAAGDTGSQFCQPVSPTLGTTPTPATGSVGVTMLNDSAQLSGGFSPFTGTITFNLFDPDQPGCIGTPVFTQAVAVSGAGAAATSGGFLANKTGTWQWTASYGGDANNNSAVSACGAEPVTIPKPVLAIVKTPDGGTFHAGDTISFSIVVTNNGPGTAV